MTVRAKTLVKDKFWIVEQNGQKLGTLQKQEGNGWIFLSKKDSRQVFHTKESLFTRFGFNIFDKANEVKHIYSLKLKRLPFKNITVQAGCDKFPFYLP